VEIDHVAHRANFQQLTPTCPLSWLWLHSGAGLLCVSLYSASKCLFSLIARPLPSNTLPSTVLQSNLPPGANRILFVKNLNYTITGDDLYDLFGRYGSIRQIRLGNEAKTKGTAFVVFDDVMDVRSFCVISIYLCNSPCSPSPLLTCERFHIHD
jgi:hypothetical protein